MQFHKGQTPWNKGRKFPQFSGTNHPLFGKPRSESVKEKLRQANLGKKYPPGSRKKPNILGPLNAHWKGGRIKTIHGYVLQYCPDHPSAPKSGYVPEHRLVVEEQIGRYLEKKNQVHHIGDRDDNRPEKLMAFVNGGAHRRFEFRRHVSLAEIIFDGRKLNQPKQEETKNGRSKENILASLASSVKLNDA